MFDLLDEIVEGFYFNCQSCGRCCRGKGEGYVFIDENEIQRISEFLRIEIDDFREKFLEEIDAEYRIFDDTLQPTKRKVFLKSKVLKQDEEDGICIFLDTESNLCNIYELRPSQCKSWPVWFSIMTNKANYLKTLEKCPGIHFKGEKFIDNAEIIENLKKEVEMDQNFIKKNKKND